MPKFECVARLKFPLKKRFTLSRVFFKKFFTFMPIGSKDLFYLTGLALLVYQINQTFFGKEPWTTFKVGHDSYSNLQSPSKIAKKKRIYKSSYKLHRKAKPIRESQKYSYLVRCYFSFPLSFVFLKMIIVLFGTM